MLFSAAVEGPSDEAALRKIVGFIGDELGKVYGRNGKYSVLSSLHGYNHSARFQPWVVLLDLDNEECAVAAKQTWLSNPSPFMCLRIAVRELEAWLLADRERFSSYFSVSQDIVPLNPDGLLDPKLALISTIRRSRRTAIREDMIPDQNLGQSIGPAYTSRIIEYIRSDDGWRVDIAAENSPSLLRAINAITNLRAVAQSIA